MSKIIGLMASIYDKDEQNNPTEEHHLLIEHEDTFWIVRVKKTRTNTTNSTLIIDVYKA